MDNKFYYNVSKGQPLPKMLVVLLSLFWTTMLVTTTNAYLAVPVLHYNLDMDTCRQNKIINGTNGNVNHNNASTFLNQGTLGKESMGLIRNPLITSCSLGMGVEIYNRNVNEIHPDNMPSTNEVSHHQNQDSFLYGSMPFVQAISVDTANSHPGHTSNGWAFALWLRLPNSDGSVDNNSTTNVSDPKQTINRLRKPILSFGFENNEEVENNDSPSNSFCDDNMIDFQLSMIGEHQLEMIYRTSETYFVACQRLVMDIPTSSSSTSALAHISISLAHRHQEIFLNGQSLSYRKEAFDNNLNHWNPLSVLHFFSFPSRISDEDRNLVSWNGQIFQFSIYNDVRDTSQVQSMMSEGLPPTQPYALTKTARINEDAVDNDGNLQNIDLPISFLDRDMDDLLTRIGLPHQPAAKVYLYITRFPSRGILLDPIDQQRIEKDENVPVLLNDSQWIGYVPKLNEYSEFPGVAYSSFEFCATTNRNTILTSTQCSSATVTVVVDPINDPPEATVPPLYFVHEGIYEEPQGLHLTGTDVDVGDSIQAIEISGPPKQGFLYLSVTTFRENDRLSHGTLLSDINNIIDGNEAYVEYRFTGYDETVVRGNSVKDTFRFRVQDTTGSWSEEAEAEIIVLPNIFPLKDSVSWEVPSQTKEDTKFSIAWNDGSGINRTSGVFIESLPEKGDLLDPVNGIVEKESIVESFGRNASDDTNKISLRYKPQRDFCANDLSEFVNDTFSYRIVSHDDSGQILSVSASTSETIRVECEVEPITLSVEEPELSVTAFSSRMDHPCSGYVFNQTQEAKMFCSDIVLFPGFRILNLEKQFEPIFVHISSQHGFLSFDQKTFENVTMLNDQIKMRPDIKFLSLPANMNKILSTLLFQSDMVGTDEIKITLQYGKCQHTKSYLLEHEFSISGPECYTVEGLINVSVFPNPEVKEEFLYRGFPWISLPFTFCMLIFLKLRGKSREILMKQEQSTRAGEDRTCDLTSEQTIELRWKQHYDLESGFHFYQNLEDGEVTWDPPLDEDFIPAVSS